MRRRAPAAEHAGSAEALLTSLADAGPPIPAQHVAVVVAHPDDETIGCGAQLPRLRGALLIVVTDGAPRNGRDARALGFASAHAYGNCRTRELARALAIAANPELRLVRLAIPDQQAACALETITRILTHMLAEAGIAVVLTHAYEGGHPDHDATAFAVHAAAGALRQRGRELAVVEMPFYRLGRRGVLYQRFARGGPQQHRIALTREQRVRKGRMLHAHASQARVLAAFALDAERFRLAPAYDFNRLPNGGRLLYDEPKLGRDLGISGARWRTLARRALVRSAAERPC